MLWGLRWWSKVFQAGLVGRVSVCVCMEASLCICRERSRDPKAVALPVGETNVVEFEVLE